MNVIKSSIDFLNHSGVILYPTDTIWGLGCDARDQQAIEKIIEIKNRPIMKSFIILAKSWNQIQRYTSHDLSQYDHYFQKYGDRPTSFILDVMFDLPDILKHDQDKTIAVRIPNSKFCNELFEQFDAPIVSTSANISGAPSPLTFHDIEFALLQSVDFVVPYSYEDSVNKASSRIVKIAKGEEIILRNG